MRDGGRVAYPNGVEPEPHVRPGVTINAYDVVADRAAIDRLNRLIEAGPFEVHVARTFRLDQAAEAHRALDAHYLGKMALQTT
jgi:NADPH:quinone reductase-like Zn-dependent oxidoreductase